jgi:hypothetical protein
MQGEPTITFTTEDGTVTARLVAPGQTPSRPPPAFVPARSR